jgi:hypothetical protein
MNRANSESQPSERDRQIATILGGSLSKNAGASGGFRSRSNVAASFASSRSGDATAVSACRSAIRSPENENAPREAEQRRRLRQSGKRGNVKPLRARKQ